jgi:hypothetical protein
MSKVTEIEKRVYKAIEGINELVLMEADAYKALVRIRDFAASRIDQYVEPNIDPDSDLI